MPSWTTARKPVDHRTGLEPFRALIYYSVHIPGKSRLDGKSKDPEEIKNSPDVQMGESQNITGVKRTSLEVIAILLLLENQPTLAKNGYKS